MTFRLALALGCFVADIENRMSYPEFCEWCEFYAIEPFGEIRADMRAGLVAARNYNKSLPKNSRAKAITPADGILFDALDKKRGKTAAEDVEGKIRGFDVMKKQKRPA